MFTDVSSAPFLDYSFHEGRSHPPESSTGLGIWQGRPQCLFAESMNSRWRGWPEGFTECQEIKSLASKPITFFFRDLPGMSWEENGLQVSVRTASDTVLTLELCKAASLGLSPVVSAAQPRCSSLVDLCLVLHRNQGGLVRSEPSHLGQGPRPWGVMGGPGPAPRMGRSSRPLQNIYPSGTSLMVPWLRLHAPNAWGPVLSLDGELDSTCHN